MGQLDSQNDFWATSFGEDYIKLNNGVEVHAANVQFFDNVFKKLGGVPLRYLNLGRTLACSKLP